ncbi:MAG TPA: Flp family type IVb pilin [Ornithinibacter sp.]|nr:Flp family type IVb pilin [Ornithinibacter sp.]
MTLRLSRWRLQLVNERGATAVEYALMVTLIALVIISAVVLLGANLSGIFLNARNRI